MSGFGSMSIMHSTHSTRAVIDTSLFAMRELVCPAWEGVNKYVLSILFKNPLFNQLITGALLLRGDIIAEKVFVHLAGVAFRQTVSDTQNLDETVKQMVDYAAQAHEVNNRPANSGVAISDKLVNQFIENMDSLRRNLVTAGGHIGLNPETLTYKISGYAKSLFKGLLFHYVVSSALETIPDISDWLHSTVCSPFKIEDTKPKPSFKEGMCMGNCQNTRLSIKNEIVDLRKKQKEQVREYNALEANLKKEAAKIVNPGEPLVEKLLLIARTNNQDFDIYETVNKANLEQLEEYIKFFKRDLDFEQLATNTRLIKSINKLPGDAEILRSAATGYLVSEVHSEFKSLCAKDPENPFCAELQQSEGL